MLISYRKADPSGNITGLVESPVEISLRPLVTQRVLSACPDMEQLGFVSPCGAADIRLDMSGGEFCGNATLSAAALELQRKGMDSGTVAVSVSGAERPLSVEVEKVGEGEYRGRVDMPLPKSVGQRTLPGGMSLPVVEFPGISHVIAGTELSDVQAMELIAPWCRALGAEALGVMLFDEKAMALRPLVWVPGSGTLFWERSCASGSSALGAWLALRDAFSRRIVLRQPGGEIGAEAQVRDGRLCSLYMSGRVKLFDAKTLEII